MTHQQQVGVKENTNYQFKPKKKEKTFIKNRDDRDECLESVLEKKQNTMSNLVSFETRTDDHTCIIFEEKKISSDPLDH